MFFSRLIHSRKYKFLILILFVKFDLYCFQGDGDGGGGGAGGECGAMQNTIKTKFRVVGGGPARIGNYPWQLSLRLNNVHICGATIISNEWILTAAHCYRTSTLMQQYSVYAGTHLKNNVNGAAKVFRITNVHVHPQYNRRILFADVAVMKVTPKFEFTTGIQNGAIGAVCMPTAQQVYTNRVAIVSGYGWSGRYRSEYYLKAAKVQILDHYYCERVYRYRRVYSRQSMLCAGSLYGGSDACFGDDGGPLSILDNNKVTQIGIVSSGLGCGRRGYPRVYMNVAVFRNWIGSKIAPQGKKQKRKRVKKKR